MQHIEWNPVRGCDIASPGCNNCAVLHDRANEVVTYGPAGGLSRQWSGGTVTVTSDVSQPQRIISAAMIYVCSQGDLFFQGHPATAIDMVFKIMESAPWHQYQILTKRPDYMVRYVNERYAGRGGPPPNMYFGISIERQFEANKRLPVLHMLLGGNLYLTCYPLLGDINIGPYLALGRILWVVAGDEPERRANAGWKGHLEGQCRLAAVPFHWGAMLGAES